jgi:hypothetical protein
MQRIASIILLIIVLTSLGTRAQTFYSGNEFGLSIGAAQYFGDLNDEYGLKFVRPAGGFTARFHINPFISIRPSLLYAYVGYDDKFSSNEFSRRRNLNFRSDIIEASVQAEFNFFRFATGDPKARFTPYLTGGIGAFYYNPYTFFNGQKYHLRALGTEGQNAGFNDRKYSTVSMCFPVGAGIKYWVRPGLNVGFEVADRLTVTDYMDDVSTTYVGSNLFPNDPIVANPAYVLQDRSIELGGEPLGRAGKQRGNAASKDQYMTFLINITVQLKTYKCPSYIKEGYYMY